MMHAGGQYNAAEFLLTALFSQGIAKRGDPSAAGRLLGAFKTRRASNEWSQPLLVREVNHVAMGLAGVRIVGPVVRHGRPQVGRLPRRVGLHVVVDGTERIGLVPNAPHLAVPLDADKAQARP